MSSEAGEEGIISTNPQHSKWISDKQGCSLSQRSFPSIFPRTKLPFPSRWFYPDCTESLLHACHCRLYPSDAECRGSMGTVGLWWHWERPHLGAVLQGHIQGQSPGMGAKNKELKLGVPVTPTALMLWVNAMLKTSYCKTQPWESKTRILH